MTATVDPRLLPLVRDVDRRQPLAARIEAISRKLVGRPYVTNPLIGSAREPEVFTADVSGFDCVTYVETVLAAALSSSPAAFDRTLRRIRYDGGRVSWRRRNHYTTDWLRRNTRAGLLSMVTVGGPAVTRRRRLTVLPGYPVREISVRAVPKARFWKARAKVATGDIIVFASTRRNRDTFHLGFAVWDGDHLLLRDARKSRGDVGQGDLADFLAVNSMAGVIVARPVDRRRRYRF